MVIEKLVFQDIIIFQGSSISYFVRKTICNAQIGCMGQ